MCTSAVGQETVGSSTTLQVCWMGINLQFYRIGGNNSINLTSKNLHNFKVYVFWFCSVNIRLNASPLFWEHVRDRIKLGKGFTLLVCTESSSGYAATVSWAGLELRMYMADTQLWCCQYLQDITVHLSLTDPLVWTVWSWGLTGEGFILWPIRRMRGI